MPGKASCHSTEWSEVFIQVGLSIHYPFVFVRLYCLYPVHTNTHTFTHTYTRTHIYESSFISWLSVLAIFLGGAGLSPSPCSCSLFFAAFCVTQRIVQQSVQLKSFFLITIKLQRPKINHRFMMLIIKWDLIKTPKITVNKWSGTYEINFKGLHMLTFLSHCWWR